MLLLLARVGAKPRLVGRVVCRRAAHGTPDALAADTLGIVTTILSITSGVAVISLSADNRAGDALGAHLCRGVVLLMEGHFGVVGREDGTDLASIVGVIVQRRFCDGAATGRADWWCLCLDWRL